MRILIEGHHYDAALVRDSLDGVIDYFESIEREVVVNYVGYLYNPRIKDCVFILPKVLVDKEGKAFSHLAPEELKDQKDGKRVDHLYRDQSLTTANDSNAKSVFYIGDSKYYELKNEIGEESVYKQYTYARNVIQWNMNIFLDPTEQDAKWREKVDNLRDEQTEGYNIVPNC